MGREDSVDLAFNIVNLGVRTCCIGKALLIAEVAVNQNCQGPKITMS